MNVKKRVVTIGAGLLIAGAGTVAAAPLASAIGFTPAPGGGTVHLNSTESQVLHAANIGGAVDAVAGWHGSSTPGDAINEFSGKAAQYPSGHFYAGTRNFGTPNVIYVVGWSR